MLRKSHKKNHVLVVLLVALFSLPLAVNFASQQTNLSSRAQTPSVQSQCSPLGKVQFLISFTNPESYPINLLADVLIQTQTISRNYISIAPGKTRTGIIRTDMTSLSNVGDVIFTWSPVDNASDSKNINASFAPITCEPTVATPTPSSQLTTEEATDSSILALTPLPPQPEVTPEPFYHAWFSEGTSRFKNLVYNFFRFIHAFTTGAPETN